MTGRQGRLGVAWALAAGLGLAGCGQGASPTASGAVTPAIAAPPAAGDILAPDVFQVREEGLWDGRPSLGGVWVAHPDVGEPDRVRIVNAETGQEVVGALFRREREMPGPSLQVSSDAAQALGILAGDPTPLEVTALRRADAPVAAPPAPAPADPAAGDLVASAAAAIAASEAPADLSPVPVPVAAVDPAAIERVAQATAAILAAAPPEPAPSPDPVPEALPAPVEVAAPVPEVAPAAPAAPRRPWWRRGDGGGAPMTALAPGAIATTALDAPATVPAEAAAAPVAEAPAAAPAEAAQATYVQVGRFGVEANARALAQSLSEQGLPAGVVDPEPGVWLVWIGPATEPGEAEALRAAAVAAGYPDAYLVNG